MVGSFVRKDHPLFAQRLRQATRRGAKLMSISRLGRRLAAMNVSERVVAAPSAWVNELADMLPLLLPSWPALPLRCLHRKPRKCRCKRIASALWSG